MRALVRPLSINTQHPSARAPSRARAPLPDPHHAAAQSSSAALEPPARPPPAALLAVDEDVTPSRTLWRMWTTFQSFRGRTKNSRRTKRGIYVNRGGPAASPLITNLTQQPRTSLTDLLPEHLSPSCESPHKKRRCIPQSTAATTRILVLRARTRKLFRPSGGAFLIEETPTQACHALATTPHP